MDKQIEQISNKLNSPLEASDSTLAIIRWGFRDMQLHHKYWDDCLKWLFGTVKIPISKRRLIKKLISTHKEFNKEKKLLIQEVLNQLDMDVFFRELARLYIAEGNWTNIVLYNYRKVTGNK